MLGEFRKLDGWARWAAILVGATAGFEALESLTDLMLLPKLEGWAEGTGSRPSDLLGLSNTLYAFVLLGYLAAGIAFIGWLHSAYANIQNMGAVNLRRSTGWAIGAWLIPLISLIWPKEIVDDTWRGSEPSLAAGPSEAWKPVRVPSYIHWWWACWLTGSILGSIGQSLNSDNATFAAIRAGTFVSLAGSVAIVAAALLAIKLVRELTSRQNDRHDSLMSRPAYAPAGPPPTPDISPHSPPPPPPPPSHDSGFRPGPAAG